MTAPQRMHRVTPLTARRPLLAMQRCPSSSALPCFSPLAPPRGSLATSGAAKPHRHRRRQTIARRNPMNSHAHIPAVRSKARASVLTRAGTLAIAALALGTLSPADPAFAAGSDIVGWGDDHVYG